MSMRIEETKKSQEVYKEQKPTLFEGLKEKMADAMEKPMRATENSPQPISLLSENQNEAFSFGPKQVDELEKPDFIFNFGLPENDIIEGTDGNDLIEVNKIDDNYYSVAITDESGTVNTYILTEEELAQMRIEGAAGDDTIIVSDEIDVGITIDGGDGNDSISGGSGDDTISGGAGNDQLRGGAGADKIDGGSGHDFIQGGLGADKLVGGIGSDSIYADADDTVYTGTEANPNDSSQDVVVAHESATIINGAEDAVVRITDEDIADAKEWLGTYAVIDGDSEFSRQMVWDIAAMGTTEQGSALLSELGQAFDESGAKLTFEEYSTRGAEYDPISNTVTIGSWTDVREGDAMYSPLTNNFHELVHAWQTNTGQTPKGYTVYDTGTLINNVEAQATGLPWIDENGVVHSADSDDSDPYSDNLFREELGIGQRTRHGSDATGTPSEYQTNIFGFTEPDEDAEDFGTPDGITFPRGTVRG